MYMGEQLIFSQQLLEKEVWKSISDMYDTEKLGTLITKKTKLVWIESPSNPNMNIYDLKRFLK